MPVRVLKEARFLTKIREDEVNTNYSLKLKRKFFLKEVLFSSKISLFYYTIDLIIKAFRDHDKLVKKNKKKKKEEEAAANKDDSKTISAKLVSLGVDEDELDSKQIQNILYQNR